MNVGRSKWWRFLHFPIHLGRILLRETEKTAKGTNVRTTQFIHTSWNDGRRTTSFDVDVIIPWAKVAYVQNPKWQQKNKTMERRKNGLHHFLETRSPPSSSSSPSRAWVRARARDSFACLTVCVCACDCLRAREGELERETSIVDENRDERKREEIDWWKNG